MKDTFYPRSVALVLTTTPSVVYTAPASFVTEVESILVTNTTNANADVTIEWYDPSSASWSALIYLRPIAGYGFLQLQNSLFLSRSGAIRASVGTHAAVTISLKLKEYFIQNNV